MKLMVAQAWSVLMQLALFGSAAARGLPADLRMLALVPPESEIVVGIVPTPGSRHQGSFVLFTLANTIDYEDFLSLAAADPLLQIDGLIFTATAGSRRATAEHSVIISGRLRADRIYRSTSYPSDSQVYRGVAVQLVRPFGRERAYLRQDRLLAVIGSNLAIFGTPSSVREEIDRFLDAPEADSLMVQRVSLLTSDDASWYLVRSPLRCEEFARILKNLDPALSESDGEKDLLFGIRYGKQVEIEYSTTEPAIPAGGRVLHASAQEMFRDQSDQLRPGVRVVKVGRGRFEKWLKQATEH